MPPFFFLGYGVMVTLQILVLPFLVRVRVAQRSQSESHPPSGWLFFFVPTYLQSPLSKDRGKRWLSRKTWGKEFHKRCLYTIFSPQTFTMADANVCDGGCKRLRERMQTFAVKRGSALQGRMQCTARTDAVHCGSGCSALQGRLQCTASETGKRGTEIASPILDKRKGR